MRKVSLCAPDELGDTEVTTWHRFQAEDRRQANPFLSPEFAQVLGRHRDDVRIAVLEEDSHIVGFLPHHRSRHGVARSLAHGHGRSNLEGLVLAPDHVPERATLLEQCGLGVWEFDFLPAFQAELLQPHVTSLALSPFVDLAPGWTSWFESRRASTTVRKVLQKQRKLAREQGPVTFAVHDPRPEVLRQLMGWKSEQYRRSGRLDPFSSPWYVELVAELTATSTPHFSGMLSVLSADGRPVAAQLALTAHGVVSGWFTAYDRAMAAYSPGLACLLELVHAAADLGMSEIDLATGRSDYKDVLKDGEHVVVKGWVDRPSPAAALRRLQRDAYDFAYRRPALKKIGIDLVTYGRRRAAR